MATLTLDKVDKFYGPEGPHAVHAVEDVNMAIGMARSSPCSARRAAARPRRCG